jgi:hypothetical protein
MSSVYSIIYFIILCIIMDGGHSVGIVRLRTKGHGICLFVL